MEELYTGASVATLGRTGGRCDKLRRCHGLWHDRRFAAKGFSVGAFIGGACNEPEEEPAQQAPPMNTPTAG